MYGELYGTLYLDTPEEFSPGIPDISFNGYSLKTDNITIQEMNVEDAPNIEYNDYNVPRDNGKGFLSRFFRERIITLRGSLKDTTANALNDLIDDFKKNVSEETAVFKYVVNGVHRETIATAVSINIPRKHFHLTFVPFEVQFRTTDAFFYNSSNLTSITAGQTTSPFTIEITNDGSAESKPQVYMTFNSASGVSSVSVALNNRTIGFSGAIAATNLLVLDSLNKVVTLNGVDQDYTGTFPVLNKGVNSLEFTVNGTFSVDVSILYRKNFL